MKQIRGITQQKFMKILIPLDRECCEQPEFLTEVITQETDNVLFSGNGTTANPLSATAIVHTQDTSSVTFTGDGTIGNPLQAVSTGGGGPTPNIQTVLSAGNTVTRGTTLDFEGGSPTSGNKVGSIYGSQTAFNEFIISSVSGYQLRLIGGTIVLDGVLGTLPTGANAPITTGMNWQQALANLQAQITALQTP